MEPDGFRRTKGIDDLFLRELGSPIKGKVHRHNAFDFDVLAAKKLTIESTLRGHNGCVNRMAWNEQGDLLASASDDRCIRLWRYPDGEPRSMVIQTWHQANIFGIQFLPQTSSSRLVTGAMDHAVQLHYLDVSPGYQHQSNFGSTSNTPRRTNNNPGANTTGLRSGGEGHENESEDDDDDDENDNNEGSHGSGPSRAHTRERYIPSNTTTYACHRGRVKNIEVEPLNPHLFWSSSEDGTIRQFDTRLPAQDFQRFESPNVLVAIRSKSRLLELKSLALNPTRPDQLAVGAGDAYVRVYDRRKLGPLSPGRAARSAQPMLMLAPPHLSLAPASQGGGTGRIHTTHVTFGNRGDKVLGTYHGDHAYCWDITGAPDYKESDRIVMKHPLAVTSNILAASIDFFWGAEERMELKNRTTVLNATILPPEAEELWEMAMACDADENIMEAVHLFSEAIRCAPGSDILYSSRALSLAERDWEGDRIASLFDYEKAMDFCPADDGGIMLQWIKGLSRCKLFKSAEAGVQLFKTRFPHAIDKVTAIEEKIQAELLKRSQEEESSRQQLEQRRNLRRRRGFSRPRRRRRGATGEGESGGDAGTSAGTMTVAGTSADHASDVIMNNTNNSNTAGGAITRGETEQFEAEERQVVVGSSAADARQNNTAAAAGTTTGPGPGGAGTMTTAIVVISPRPVDGTTAAAATIGSDTNRDTWEDSSSNDHDNTDEDEDDEEEEYNATSKSELLTAAVDAAYAEALLEYNQQEGSGHVEGDKPSTSSALKTTAAKDAFIGPRLYYRQQLQPRLYPSVSGSRRHIQTYIGQCNIQTDIKESVFLGSNDQLVASGSDCGRVFIHEASTGRCVRILHADEDVVNCIRPHPNLPVLATSGIENVIRLWTPEGPPTDGGNLAEVVAENQQRMKHGPQMLRGLDARLLAALTDHPELLQALTVHREERRGEEESEDEEGHGVGSVRCRVA